MLKQFNVFNKNDCLVINEFYVFLSLIEVFIERRLGDNSAPSEVNVKQVALFATPATVAMRAFQRELVYRAIGVDMQSCGGLVDVIK